MYSSTCCRRPHAITRSSTTAVVELLMMGVRTPKTCWAVHKRHVINLRNCCIWLVNFFQLQSTFSHPAVCSFVLLCFRHFTKSRPFLDKSLCFKCLLRPIDNNNNNVVQKEAEKKLKYKSLCTRSVRKVSDRIFLCEHLMDYNLARLHEPTLNLSAHAW
jgi:hypothetical protein